MNILRIYTDGACSGNQNEKNIGGWGAILEFGPHRKELYGGEPDTTNNRMEMTALLEGLRAIKKPAQNIEVFSDSSYLMNCFREKWYEKWMANGWLTTKKEPVENRDLWEELLPFLSEHSIAFYRVKGHVSLAWHLSQGTKASEEVPAANNANSAGAKTLSARATYKNILSITESLTQYPGAGELSGTAFSIDSTDLPQTLQKRYADFKKWNGSRFTPIEFLYVTRMNNRADALANMGMDEIR